MIGENRKVALLNLLGGRAWRFELFPLTWPEIPDFDLLRPMSAFQEEFAPRRAIVVTSEDDRRRVGDINVMPYQNFLRQLHSGEIL